jgi:molybdopterin-synthase adenylyltransferase
MAGLNEPVRSPNRGDNALPTVDDGTLLLWAEEHHRSPAVAVMEALRRGIIPTRYSKNLIALTLEEQLRICGSTVLVCGCGGLGGIVVQLLARSGVGRLRLIDGDVFTESNMNRQLLSDSRVLSQPKVRVAEHVVRMVNPFVVVEAVQEILTDSNTDQLVKETDLVVDALDNIEGRWLLAASARTRGVPFVHGAVAGWWGQVSTFMPMSAYDLGAIYGSMRSRDAGEQDLGVLGPMAAAVGSLQALEVLRLVCGRPAAYSDRLLYFDGESGRIEVVPLEPAHLG